MRHCGDRDRGRGDQSEREQRDGPQVLPQLAQAGVVGGGIEERRQDADEHDVGRHREVGQTGSEAEREPAEHEQDRVRDPQGLRQQQQRGRRHEQQQKLQFLVAAEVRDHRESRARSRAQSDGRRCEASLRASARAQAR